jgi:hypothetical protein
MRPAFSIAVCLLLSGCILIGSNAPDPFIWHGKDAEAFVKEHYPVGSDAATLIEDFTQHGYKYLPERGMLIAKGGCSFIYGSWGGVNVQFSIDKAGKIATERVLRIDCIMWP